MLRVVAVAAATAAAGLIILRTRRWRFLKSVQVRVLPLSMRGRTDFGSSSPAVRKTQVCELGGKYYQVLGHAWDHTQEDFCVVYRPLYHCEAKPNRFEAHIMATSSFERWESKFKQVAPEDIPDDVLAWLLPGPFARDPHWCYHGQHHSRVHFYRCIRLYDRRLGFPADWIPRPWWPGNWRFNDNRRC